VVSIAEEKSRRIIFLQGLIDGMNKGDKTSVITTNIPMSKTISSKNEKYEVPLMRTKRTSPYGY